MAFNQPNNPFKKIKSPYGSLSRVLSGSSRGFYSDAKTGHIYSGRGEGGSTNMYQGLTSDQDGFRSTYSGTNLGSQNRPGARYGEATLGRYDFETGNTYYNFADKPNKITDRDVDFYKKEFGYDIPVSDSNYKPQPKTESGSVDWQKVDKGRRQRAANTARYGMTDRESRKFQRQQNRAKRKRLRQQKRETRRRERQIKRRNKGGFLRRLFT